MEQTEINKRNEAIAIFMGGFTRDFVDVWKWKNERGNFEYGKLQYNSSWDWLMPVLIKIINLHSSGCNICGIGYAGPSFYFDMLPDEKIGFQSKSEEGNEIEAVFIAVSDYCIYQEEKKSKKEPL